MTQNSQKFPQENPTNFLQNLSQKEMTRQKNTLNLIASENYPSPAVLNFLSSAWSLKYGEGYPQKRYYAGNENTDTLENYAKKLALKTFDKTGQYHVNVQVLSGSNANMLTYLALLEPNDVIMSLSIENGGHISHLSKTSNWNKFFRKINYDVKLVETVKTAENGENQTNQTEKTSQIIYEIDEEDFIQKIKEHRPKLVIIGFSAYPRQYKFKKLIQIAHFYGCMVLADVAHINGLIASDLHDTPFNAGDEGADFISMTTHKTLRGPRGALLFCKKEFANILDKTIFPGTLGGPHFQQICAVARCLEEILGIENYPDQIDFKTYSQNVLKNTKSLENGLKSAGLKIISPTQNHLCLVELPSHLDSLQIQQKLENQGFILNRNSLPFDKKTAYKPSGLRLGMAALTSRGIGEKDSFLLGEKIGEVVLKNVDHSDFVSQTVQKLNWWY